MVTPSVVTPAQRSRALDSWGIPTRYAVVRIRSDKLSTREERNTAMNRNFLANIYRLAGFATVALAAAKVVAPKNANW